MLNYIWLFIIVIALIAGIANDISDEINDPYRNGVVLEVRFIASQPYSVPSGRMEGLFYLDAKQFNDFYGIKTQVKEVRQKATLTISENGMGYFIFTCDDSTPSRWKDMAKWSSSKGKLTGEVKWIKFSEPNGWAKAGIVFEPFRFLKLKAITQAAIEFAALAVQIAIGLIGIMALWLGLIKIAEEAGFIKLLTRILAPITKRLFPDVPTEHPAVGAIVMNIAANMLGLSNAATPMGLKAMEELNKLNPKAGTATNAMVTFLAINTGGLILIPATAIAVRAAAGSANPGIIIGTSIFGAGCATIAGVLASKILQRLPRYKLDDKKGR